MKRACSYCGKIHEYKEPCPTKPSRSQHNRHYDNGEDRKFRSSGKWTKKAIEIKERDNYCCQVCFDEKRINYKNLEVHHIVKLRDNSRLGLDNSNLITLCSEHHKMADTGEISANALKEILKKRGFCK